MKVEAPTDHRDELLRVHGEVRRAIFVPIGVLRVRARLRGAGFLAGLDEAGFGASAAGAAVSGERAAGAAVLAGGDRFARWRSQSAERWLGAVLAAGVADGLVTGAASSKTKLQVKELPRAPAPLDVLADPPGSLRALAPGKSASVSLWWSNWCGPGSVPTGSPGTPPDGLELGLAGGTSLVVPLAQAPRCDAPQSPSLLSVGPFAPTERHPPASSRLPLRAVIVGARPVQVKPGLRAFRVYRDALLRYEVEVTNTGMRVFRFAGSSCPVYIEQVVPGLQQVYVLNCRPAGTLAPGATVLFAMQLRIPSDARLGNTSLTWELAPKTYQAPFASAAVWVAQ